jgi:hypothetical protein
VVLLRVLNPFQGKVGRVCSFHGRSPPCMMPCTVVIAPGVPLLHSSALNFMVLLEKTILGSDRPVHLRLRTRRLHVKEVRPDIHSHVYLYHSFRLLQIEVAALANNHYPRKL